MLKFARKNSTGAIHVLNIDQQTDAITADLGSLGKGQTSPEPLKLGSYEYVGGGVTGGGNNPPIFRAASTYSMNTDLYDAVSSGTGLFNLGGKTWYDDVIADNYTTEQLDVQRYVTCVECQQFEDSVKNGHKTKQDTLKTKYQSLGLTPPKVLMPVRQWEFKYQNGSSMDSYLNTNIAAYGPMWAYPAGMVTSFPGETVALPSAAGVEVANGKVGIGSLIDSNITFADVEALWTTASWTFHNKTVNPIGAGFPYQFNNDGGNQKEIRYEGVRMKINATSWVESLGDLAIAHLQDTTSEIDGIILTFGKYWQYYSPWYGSDGKRPDGGTSGTSLRKLNYWAYTREDGGTDDDPSLATRWNLGTDTPTFGNGAILNTFDDPTTTAYDYVEGLKALAIYIQANKPTGKEVWIEINEADTGIGIWSQYKFESADQGSTIRYGWWADYALLNDLGTVTNSVRQVAQAAYLNKILELRDVADGLIVPCAQAQAYAEGATDAVYSSVTLQPTGWFDSEILNSGKDIIISGKVYS